jgi:hypothetical protein
MILCEWDAPEGDPGQSCVHLFARILSTSFSSVSIFSVCCYSIVSISMALALLAGPHTDIWLEREDLGTSQLRCPGKMFRQGK